MVKFESLRLWLRVVILILLFIFLMVFNLVPKSHCDVCELPLENKKPVDAEEFLNLYFDKCINTMGSLDMGNFSVIPS